MTARGPVVFSTGKGRMCAKCGWPRADCRCAATLSAGSERVPEKITATLRLENRASGRQVTLVVGLPDNREYLEDLCRHLKRACGTGGAVGTAHIEVQGDQRERLRELLERKGLRVQG